MNGDVENELSEQAPVDNSPALEGPPAVSAPPEEPTVGTGSYVAVTCALVMLALTIVLIGVVYVLRWI